MYLDIGNQQQIDEPTAEQLAYWLRNLPAEAPFLILNADEEHFIQAMIVGDGYRVEWRQEARQRFMIVSLETAEQAFAAYCRWDEAALNTYPWNPITFFSRGHYGNQRSGRVVVRAARNRMVAAVSYCWAGQRGRTTEQFERPQSTDHGHGR